MKRAVILGGSLFAIGILTYAGLSLAPTEHSTLFGYDIINSETHARQVREAFLMGISITTMVTGVLVIALLSWGREKVSG